MAKRGQTLLCVAVVLAIVLLAYATGWLPSPTSTKPETYEVPTLSFEGPIDTKTTNTTDYYDPKDPNLTPAAGQTTLQKTEQIPQPGQFVPHIPEHSVADDLKYFDKAAFLGSVPRVQGVPIIDRIANIKRSLAGAGMVDEATSDRLVPPKQNVGASAFKCEEGIITDTLEMEQTQQLMRTQLAAANTGYVPPEGVSPNGWWTQRNTLNNLEQPGLTKGLTQRTCK